MNRVTVTSRVGVDGVLHVAVPLGPTQANREVQVTIEPAAEPAPTSEEWRRTIRSMAGKWQGEFLCEDEGPFETRDAFP